MAIYVLAANRGDLADYFTAHGVDPDSAEVVAVLTHGNEGLEALAGSVITDQDAIVRTASADRGNQHQAVEDAIAAASAERS